jgi:hypothetical protein
MQTIESSSEATNLKTKKPWRRERKQVISREGKRRRRRRKKRERGKLK